VIKSYPKILPAVSKYADLIVGRDIQIEEKVDGSFFGFGVDEEGKLHIRSKGQAIEPTAPNDLFRPAVEHVITIQHRLPKGYVFYGETLKTARHNTLEYARVPRNHIALFGVFTDWERSVALPYEEMAEWAGKLDIDVVPLIFRGQLQSLDQLGQLVKEGRESFLGGPAMEGVVVKNYNMPMEFSGMIYPFSAFKLVSEAFKEKHSSNPDWKPQRDVLEECLEQYRSEARWMKAIQHLREKGELVGEPKDIGPLMKELWEDVLTEEKENFKEELFNIFKKRLASKVQAGFPQFYKEYLLRV